MKEVGMINSQIDSALNRQGHMDLMMVADAGFPCPDHVELIDIALSHGKPAILDVLAELKKVHSVEKILMAKETKEHNPIFLEKAARSFGHNVELELLEHVEIKKISHNVKTIIRTGDFTAWGNIILVSGAGDRWQMEK